MVLATHALVGAAIGKNINDPWIIILLSIIIHYVIDSIRHGEYVETFDSKSAFRNTWWKIILDIFIGFAIIFLVIYFKKFDFISIRNILIGIFFSMFPDSLTLIYWKTRWKLFEKLYKFHCWCHRLPKSSSQRKWNLKNETYEIITASAAIAILVLL